ncbi:MAG: hypothetical protein N3H31_05295 [Candidatus Nezhaarchaeota archaeon]|nr:hypothetical protein [Candidatus Nezhaarchaeota archaeon]
MKARGAFLARTAPCLALAVALMLLAVASLTASATAQQTGFSIVDSRAWSSSGSAKIYPGSVRVSLRIEAKYDGDDSASRAIGHLGLVSGVTFSYGSGPSTPARSLDGSVATSVDRGDHVVFDYYLDLSKSLQPGTYALTFNITYRLGTDTYLSGPFNIQLSVSSYPKIRLKVIDSYLSPASSPGSVDTDLYVVLENVGESDIASASFSLRLPPGFLSKSPRATVGAVSRGERFTVSFGDVSIPQGAQKGVYEATLRVNASMRTDDGVGYSDEGEVAASFEVTDPLMEMPLVTSSVNVLYQGSPAPLLQSARDVTVRATLINRLPEPVGGMAVAVSPPAGISVRSISGTFVNGAPSGGSCYVDLVVDVDPKVGLGRHAISLNVSYVRISEGASYMAWQRLDVSVSVESHHSYVPELVLVSAYWGSPDPRPVYGGARYVPLSLHLINNGRHDAVGVVIKASSQQLRPIKSSEALAARLTPGSYASATLYFDVDADARSAQLTVMVNYTFSEFGAHVGVSRRFEVHLPVESYPGLSSNLMVVSSGWQRGYSVFPRTENATYEVTFANRAPFQVGGILLSLKLPANISSRGSRVATAYVEGPVRSLGTFTAPFTITVGDVKPGRYVARLTADFILQSGGPGVRCVEEFSVDVFISDDSQAVEFIASSWYEGSVGPNTRGAHLLVMVRNNYVDSMKGPVLELFLPPGMLNALDNSSYVKAAPLPATLAAAGQFAQAPWPRIPLVSEPAAGQALSFSRGDVLSFAARLHVLNVSPGTHYISGAVSYVDQWGTKRAVKVSIPASVLGRVEYLRVSTSGSLSVKSRLTNITLTVENVGTSPLHDVYLVIFPYRGVTPLLIATPAVTYIGSIGAGGSVAVPVSLAYNPMMYAPQVGGVGIVTYGPVPLMVSTIYRDAGGSLRSFNNTIVVVVEPFIDLLIKDVSATGRASSSTVAGTVVNYGSATAYRVKAVFQVGGASRSVLIGDVAPGDELTFKVEVPRYEEVGVLRIEYYNVFNELYSRELQVDVELRAEAPAAPAPNVVVGVEAWVVVVAVVAFLTTAALLIHRALKTRLANRR